MYRTFQWSFKRETASWMAYNFLYNYDLIKNQHTVQQHCSMSSSSAGTRRSSLFRASSMNSTLRSLSDQITISGRKVVIAIWVGKVNDVPRSARTLHSPYGNYSLDTFPIGKSTCQITFIYSTYIKVCN